MALLTLNERKAIFKELGLGEYNEKNIKAFQKKYMLRKEDWDGKWGTDSDNTLRTVYYVKHYTKNFEPEEFRCECGGRYCCGYPSYMKPAELIHIQRIRDHFDEPIIITCGLRCKTWNSKLGGSIQNSLHMSGQAIDFYQNGVTDPLANRKRSIKWIAKQPNHHYTYGDGIYRLTTSSVSTGAVSAPYMGNALHTDTYNNVEPVHPKWVEPKVVIEATKYRPKTPFTGTLPKGTVRLGDEGADAKRLKMFLNWCIGTKFTGKGKCGTNTINALKVWEKTYGIETDGVWGETCLKKAKAIIKKYAPKEEPKKSKYYDENVIIGQACANENGRLEGGKAGDQTKGEVKLSNWSSSYGWKYVIRLNDKEKRDKLAQLAIDTCTNNHIGYDTKKPDRYTAWDLAEENGHNIKGIDKKCETTCTELVSMCLRGVGFPKKYAKRHYDVAAATKALVTDKCPLVTVYSDHGHTHTTRYLLPGDILLSSHHAAIVAKSPNAK